MELEQYEIDKIDELKAVRAGLTDNTVPRSLSETIRNAESGKTHRLYKLLDLIIQLCDCVEKLDNTIAYKSPDDFILQVEYVNDEVPKGLEEIKRLYEEIENEASYRFIDSKGQATGYSELRKLCGSAAWVGPGEKDSFGWLTGIIHTPVGKIVYG